MKWITKILTTPYPYYIPFTRSIGLLVFFSLIVPLFLILFEPFGIGRSNCPQLTLVLAGISIPIFLTLSINFYGVTRLIPVFFSEDSWSIGKESIWTVWNFLTIVGATSVYWMIVPVCSTSSMEWAEQLTKAFLIGLLPGSFCIYFNYSRALKKKLRKALNLNKELQVRIAYYENGTLKLIGENNAEVVSLNTDKLLFIKSEDNYAEIVLEPSENGGIQLIRSSLKQLDKQIDYPFIVRCHRSFIVNLAKVEAVEGNARNFKIKLVNHNDWIPVSREAYRKFTALLDQFIPQTNQAISYTSDTRNIQ